MGVTTNIEWCHHTFNGWSGCAKVSPGCSNCYAEALSHRNLAIFGTWGSRGTRVVASEAMWRQPLAWDRAAARDGVRRRVFSASLSDWLEDWSGPMVDAKGCDLCGRDGACPWRPVTPTQPFSQRERMLCIFDVRRRLLALIADTPNLDWLLLTKRPDNWIDAIGVAHQLSQPDSPVHRLTGRWLDGDPPDNVWLGASVEDQRWADERIPALQAIPAKVRFLSIEPILGPVNLSSWLFCDRCRDANTPCGRGAYATPEDNLMGGCWFRECRCSQIDWVIVGGESGPDHRPCQIEWITDVVAQCRQACVPVFVKQDSGLQPGCQGRIPDWAWACKEVPGGTR